MRWGVEDGRGMKIATAIRLWVLLLIGSGVVVAQQVAPQSNPPCGAATAKTCPIVNWPQFHFDSAHTGFNPYETILSPANVGNLVLDWKYQTAFGEEFVVSSPAVVAGAVYFGGTGFGNVYSVDARTGGTRWVWDNQSTNVGSPAVAYGKVYEADYDEQSIRVLDTGNGHLLGNWGGDKPSDVTVANGAIYASVLYIGMVHYGYVYALDANTGALLWKQLMQSGRTHSPAVANARVYVDCTPTTQEPTYMCAMDAATGDILWQYSSDSVTDFFQAAVSNGVVYVGGLNDEQPRANFVSALDAATGSLLWQRPLTGTLNKGIGFSTTTTPAVADSVVYIGTADPNDDSHGYMYAIDAHTSALLWKYETAGGINSSAAVANGVVYFGSDDENIYALDAAIGALLWKYATGGKVVSSPAVVNGMLFVGSNDTYLYAFHLPGQ